MRRRAKIAAILGGVLWTALLIVLLFQARRWALSEMDTRQARADWTTWREEVRASDARDADPVARKVPRSDEPPALLLMRDHFGVCLAGTIVFGAVVYGATVLFVRGALRGSVADDGIAPPSAEGR